MPIYTVEVEITVEADSADEAKEIVMYGAISKSRGVLDYGITCEPYEDF